MNRIEALDGIKKLNKAELKVAFDLLLASYQDYIRWNCDTKGRLQFAEWQATYFKGKYDSIKPKEAPKPFPIPPEPRMNLEDVMYRALESAQLLARTPNVVCCAPTPLPAKVCWLDKALAWVRGLWS